MNQIRYQEYCQYFPTWVLEIQTHQYLIVLILVANLEKVKMRSQVCQKITSVIIIIRITQKECISLGFAKITYQNIVN
jgi:hypothetical protein